MFLGGSVIEAPLRHTRHPVAPGLDAHIVSLRIINLDNFETDVGDRELLRFLRARARKNFSIFIDQKRRNGFRAGLSLFYRREID